MSEKFYVIHSDMSKELFRPRLIAETIVNETGVDEDLARKIQNRITQKIYKLKKDGLEEITTTQIRSEVSAHLLQEREFEAEERMNKGIFIKESDILGLLTNYDNNNANQAFAAGALEYSLFELTSKKYLRTQYSPEWLDAIDYGLTYGHDAAQYLYKGINCWVLDPRMPIRKGLRTYGDNNIGVVSGPPKHFTTVLELIEQTLGLASTYIAGGVAVASMSTFVAPFMDGLSDNEIKQAIQGFLFQCNQAFKNRGSQSMFSSIVLDLEMPEFLKEQDAYGPGGKIVGKYKDFEANAKKFIHILTEVSLEGDAEDKPLFFPNLIFNIDGADLNEWLDVFELSAKFSSPYFCSAKNNNVEYESTLGCFSSDTSLWVKIDGELQYLSFSEIDELLSANVGVTSVSNIEVLTINDDKKIVWDKAKNFIKNKPMDLFEVKLTGNRSFICDKNHTMITPALYKKSIFDCKNHLKTIGIHREDITPNKRAALYGFYCGDGKKGNDFKKGFANLMLLKPDKIEYVRNLLKSLNVDFKEKIVYHSRDNKNYTVFYFSANEIIKPNLLDVNNCAGLLEGMLSSDGYVRLNKGGFNKVSLGVEFVNTDLEISRLFKFACFNLGIKFSSRLIQPSKNQKNRVPFERIYLSCNYESVNIFKQLNLRKKQKILCDEIINDFRHINEVVNDKIKEIIPLNKSDYTYCFEVNDRIIVGSDFILSGNCRSAMPSNWTGDPNIDCMGTGNSVYTTVCLPAVALKSQEDGVDFYETLDYAMDLVRDYNKERLDWIKKLWYDYHVADFMIQEDVDGVPFYRLEDATIVLGYLGLSECLEILGYGPIYECNDKAQEIMKYMADKIAIWKKEDELRWGLFQTPAENLCYTAAQKMVERFGFKKSYAKGNEEAPFYTNSNHVPVDADIDLIQRIKIEGSNQPIGPAGNIMNVYLGESYSEASALKSLCEKIRDNTNAYFWAFTGDYSICPECHSTFKGVKEICPFDNNETDVYSRVTGYLTNVKTWNKGKRSEFKSRYRY